MADRNTSGCLESPMDFCFGSTLPTYFRKSETLSGKVKKAAAYITSHGLYEAFINGKKVGKHLLTSGWTAEKDVLRMLKVEIPVNTTAEIYVPASSAEAVVSADGLKSEGYADGYVKL